MTEALATHSPLGTSSHRDGARTLLPRLRVFLVDDHVELRARVREMLSDLTSIDVVGEAGSIVEAVDGIRSTQPDLAVLDVQLPDGSGVDLCALLRGEHPDLVCLMHTSVDDPIVRAAAANAGASNFLLKSIRGTELHDTIQQMSTRAG